FAATALVGPPASRLEDAIDMTRCAWASGLRLNAPSSVLFWILADEPVAVRHPHLGQSLRVHHIILADDVIESENVGGERVHLVIGKRLRLRPRHRTACVIEYGRGVRPVVANELYGIAVGGIERTAADQRTARTAGALFAMAERASALGIDG